MILRVPEYYKEFSCIADKCKHSCCVSWEIDVDEESYQKYCKVGGEFGRRLKESIKKEEHPHFQMIHGKCPFLSDNHLCEVYQNLGESSLCDVCTEYPRFEVGYGDTLELVLSISCEEAGRLLLTRKDPIKFIDQVVDKEQVPAYHEEEIIHSKHTKLIEEARNKCISLLQDRTLPLKKRIQYFLEVAGQVQEVLDQTPNVHKEESKEDIHTLFKRRMGVLMNMEVMEEEWSEEMNNVMRAFYSDSQAGLYEECSMKFEEYYKEKEYQFEHLLVYFVYRYLMQAAEDKQFLSRAKFCVLSFLCIRDMNRMRFLIQGEVFTEEEFIDTARIFSKEVEHSKKSMAYLKKCIKEDVFNTAQLIRQI